MKPPTLDLSAYDLLQGETKYEFPFPAGAINTEVTIDVYADKAVSLHFHIARDGIDKHVPISGGERRIDIRGRFAHLRGATISASKDATIYAFVRAVAVQVVEAQRAPRMATTELPQLTPQEIARQEMRKELRRLFPEKFKDKSEPVDPELMGDEIPERAGKGYEIEDDDELDPLPGFEPDPRVLDQAEPQRDPGQSDNRTRQDPGGGPAPVPAAPDPNRAAPAPVAPGQPEPQVAPARQRDVYYG